MSDAEGKENMDSVVMEEEIDPNYVPGEDEVIEYAKWLGMELDNDQDLFWIAREALMAPLPKNWKPCKTKDTGDIYYFNFLTGDSTWDHPCDGYYKRLYEEEKKKKEMNIKERSDENRAKAKQDVELLLGKSDAKKGKKGKKAKSMPSVDDKASGAVTTAATTGGLKLAPAVVPGKKGLEKKPLPGIANKLSNSLSEPVGLGMASLSSTGLGPLSSSTSGALTKKTLLSSKSLSAAAPVSSSVDSARHHEIGDDTSDSDSSFDGGTAAERQSKVTGNASRDSADDERNMHKKKVKSSRLSNRLKHVVSEGEDSYGSPMPISRQQRRGNDEKDSKDSAPSYRSFDSDENLRDSDESFAHTAPKNSSSGFSTPGRAKPDRGSPSPTRGFDKESIAALERERAKLDKKQTKFLSECEEVDRLKGELEIKREGLELREQRLAEEKEAFELERNKRVADAESLQKSYDVKLGAETKELQEKLVRMKEEIDDMRRENISLRQDIEKGQKSLDAEKNLRSAMSREFAEKERQFRSDIEEAKSRSAEPRGEQEQLRKENERLSKLLSSHEAASRSASSAPSPDNDARIQELVGENERLKVSVATLEASIRSQPAGSASSTSGDERVRELEGEIRVLRSRIMALESNASDATDRESRLKSQVQTLTTAHEEANEKIESLQTTLRVKRSENDDIQDEMARQKRELETLRRQNADSGDELSRLRQHAQRVHELEFIVNSERQTYTRLKSDHDQLKTELETLKRDSHIMALEMPRTPGALSNSDKDEMRMMRNQLADMELANSRLVSRHAQQREEAEQTLQQKVDEIKRIAANTEEDLKNQIVELTGKCKRLDAQLSDQAVDAEDLEKRYQIAKKRTFELQEKLDNTETELFSVKSKMKLESAVKVELEERVAALEGDVSDAREKWRAQLAESELLDSDRVQLRKQLREVADERDQMQGTIEQKSAMVSKLESDVASIEQQSNVQMTELKDEIARLNRGRHELQTSLSVVPKSSTDSPKEAHSSDITAAAAFEETNSLLREERSKVQRLTFEMEDLNIKISAMNSAALLHSQSLQEREEEIDILRHKLDTAKKHEQQRIAAASEDEYKLKSMARSADETKRQLEEEMFNSASKDRKIKQLQDEIMEMNLKQTESTDAARERDMAHRSSVGSAEVLQRQLAQLQESCDEAVASKNDLLTKLMNAQREKSAIESDFDEASFRCRMLQQEVENGGRRVEALEADITRLRNEKAQIMGNVTTAARESDDVRASMTIVISERDSLKSTVDSLRREVERLQSELHLKLRPVVTQASSTTLLPEQTVDTAASTSESVERELRQTQEALSNSELLAAQLQTQVVILKSECSHKKAEVESLRVQLTTTQNELSRRNEEITELRRSTAASLAATGPNVPHEAMAGQQMSELQSHRLMVEQSIAQQTSLVQKLEDRLRDTETAIKQHLNGMVESAKQQHHTLPSPLASPEYHKQSQRRQARPSSDISSDDVPRFRSTFKPTPKPLGARSRLKWDDTHDDVDDRMVDLTYEEGEISDEEDWRGFYRRSTSSSSSNRAVSMLRDVLRHLISREDSVTSRHPRRKGSSSRGGKHYYDDRDTWKHKLKKERALIHDVRRAVKMENTYVHEVSDELSRKRDAWRRRREQVSRVQREGGDAGDKASRHVQAELKTEGQVLNRQAEQLNDLVRQIRKAQAWVTERERKLDNWEKLHINSDKMREYSDSTSSIGGEQPDTLSRHIEKMNRLELELDRDLTMLETELVPESLGRREVPEREALRERRHADSAPYSASQPRSDRRVYLSDEESRQQAQEGTHGGIPSNRHGVTFNIGGKCYSASDKSKEQGRTHFGSQNGREGQGVLHASRGRVSYGQSGQVTSYDGTADIENCARNRVIDDPRSALEIPQFSAHNSRPSSDTSPPPKPHGKVEYYSRHFSRTGGIHSTDYAERMGSSSAVVGSLVGSSSSVSDNLHSRPPSGRDPIRLLTEERKISAAACDDHVSWLETLRREIGQFPHQQTRDRAVHVGSAFGTMPVDSTSEPDVVSSNIAL